MRGMYPLLGVPYSAPLSICQQILFLENMKCGFHLQNNQLVAEDTTYISVAKTGIGAMIYAFAHDYSIFYGIFAVCFAVFAAGWQQPLFANSNLNKSAHEAIFERNKIGFC